MYVLPQIIRAAKHNGKLSLRKDTGSIRCDQIVDLLVNGTSPHAQPGARKLLQLMGQHAWEAITGVHPSPADRTAHVRLDINGVPYHLRLDARGFIFDITSVTDKATERLSGREPWLRPGAVQPPTTKNNSGKRR